MSLRFTKMHGLGNDFMVIDAIHQEVRLDPHTIRGWSDRHFGIGFDQLLVVERARTPDTLFRYRIFNADGGEVEQCGNGARCFARFVRDKGLTDAEVIPVETAGGHIVLKVTDSGDVTVDMGQPRFAPEQIPLIAEAASTDYVLDLEQNHDLHQIRFDAVSMGNPHAVIDVEDVDSYPVETIGPLVESHHLFPKRVNAGFMQVIDRQHVRLRVFERGAGETLACGTGACAAAVSGMRRGLLDSPCQVDLSGGSLSIAWAPGESVMMTGPATTVFEGEID